MAVICFDRCPKRRRRSQTAAPVVKVATEQTPTNPNISKSFKEKRKKQQQQQPPTTNNAISSSSVIPAVQRDEEPPDDDPVLDLEPQTVSVTSCLFVMSSFVIGGAILFSIWEVCNFIITRSSNLLINRLLNRVGAMWMDRISVSQVC